jgi:hypothetical protein
MMRVLLISFALAGCAALGQKEDDGAELARQLAGRSAGAAQRCAPITQAAPLEIVDRQTLAYRVGSTIYVNRLANGCPGLRPFNTLVIETQGSQYCRGDWVRSVEPGASIPGPICPLGDFVPYRLPGRG